MRNLALLSLLMALSAHAVAADDWDFAAPHKDRCSDGGQRQMNGCLAAEYRTADKRLNDKYQHLLRVLKDGAQLKKAQVAWLRFRDLTCDFETSGVGREGSLYPYSRFACLIDLAEKRVRDFDSDLESTGGGAPERKDQ